jgi:hypothetical protein
MPGTVLAHPLGGLEVRQRSVPIDTDLDRLGGYLVSEHRVTLGLPTLGGTAVAGATPTTDLFSPGQFRRLTDDARLSQPAFAPFVSGWSLSAPGPSHEGARDADYRWETCYPGQALDSSGAETFTFASAVVPGALRSSPVGRSRGTPYAVAGEPLRDWSVT